MEIKASYHLVSINLKLKKFYVSKLVTDWKADAAWVFFFFFFLCFFCLLVCLLGCLFVCLFVFSRSIKFESVTTFVQCKIWNFIFWWARYKTSINQSTEFKKFVVQCVLLCLLYLVMCILEKKIKKGKKNKSLNFAESNAQRDT